MKPFDINKCPRNEKGNWLCKTRSGFPVELVSTNARAPYKFIGYLKDQTSSPSTWMEDGRYSNKNEYPDLNLVNLPQKVTKWIAIFQHNIRKNTIYVTSALDSEARAIGVLCGTNGSDDWTLLHTHSFEVEEQ